MVMSINKETKIRACLAVLQPGLFPFQGRAFVGDSIPKDMLENGTGDIAEAADTRVFVDTTNPEVFKAYALGSVSGTDAGKRLFSPKALITREQVATMLYRTINAMGIREDGIAFAFYQDDEQISDYAREAIQYMGGYQFILGSGGYFNPKGTCTREMATLIATRVFERANSGNARPMTDEQSEYDNYYEEPYEEDYVCQMTIVNQMITVMSRMIIPGTLPIRPRSRAKVNMSWAI